MPEKGVTTESEADRQLRYEQHMQRRHTAELELLRSIRNQKVRAEWEDYYGIEMGDQI